MAAFSAKPPVLSSTPLRALIRSALPCHSTSAPVTWPPSVTSDRIVTPDRNSTPRLTASRSEDHTSELQSLMRTSYAVFCLKKQKSTTSHTTDTLSQAHHYHLLLRDHIPTSI